MRDIIKMGLILLIITSIAAFVLGITNDVTQAIIQERLEQENIESIRALLPEASEFNRVEDVDATAGVVEVYEGSKDGTVVGYTVKTEQNGYGGNVVILIGMSIDGEIVGVKIAEHSETPGLGSKITDASFVNQYVGKGTANQFNVTKDQPAKDEDIQAISGATVSSRAVTDGVNSATELFESTLKNR
ncbi:RnfABCDGE type electron transport complex subunit G [Alkaliphilus crotonatoxidans]